MTRAVSADSAEHYLWGDGCDGWRLADGETLSVILERVPAGRGEARHYHRRARQFFFVLEGRATLRVGEDTVVLEAGQGVEVPPLVPHRMDNATGQDVVFLVISGPTSQGDRHEAPAGADG